MFKQSVLLTLCLFLCFSCSKVDSPTSISKDAGSATVNIHVGKIGDLSRTHVLARATAINLSKLFITLSAHGESTILDTLPLSGNNQAYISKTYGPLASLKQWTLTATSKDQNDSIIHNGTQVFTVQPKQTLDLPALVLDASYSMLKANFFPIRDSVTRCELLVDGNKVDDSSFAKQSLIGDTVKLVYDYLKTNIAQRIKMDVYGSMWGFDTLLYTGDTAITPLPGVNSSYSITLRWVGPALPPAGQATMTVILGSVGTVVINGYLQSQGTILLQDDFEDGVWDNSKWIKANSCGSTCTDAVGNYSDENDGMLKIVQNQTDFGGRVNAVPFTVNSMGKIIITSRSKIHYANQYFHCGFALYSLNPDGSINSALTAMTHDNYHYNANWYGFGWAPNALLPPIWDTWFEEKVVYEPATGKSRYYINGTDSVDYTIAPLTSNRLQFSLSSYGWFTGHYTYVDWIKIEQLP